MTRDTQPAEGAAPALAPARKRRSDGERSRNATELFCEDVIGPAPRETA